MCIAVLLACQATIAPTMHMPPCKHLSRTTAWSAASALLLGSCSLYQQAASTPQRPRVAFNTQTTAPGTVEVEAGVLEDPGDFFDTPTRIKYGTSEDTDLFVGWSPLQVRQRSGSDGQGSGDLVLGARHRIWRGTDSRPSGAIVLSGKLPAASTSEGLGTGETDVRIGGVLNQQFASGLNANLFYQYGALGVPGGQGTNSEHTATLTLGIPLDERWGAFAEVGGVFVPAQSVDATFAIVGGTYSHSPALVLDAGLNVGLSSDAADLQVFFGCTFNLGKIARLMRAP